MKFKMTDESRFVDVSFFDESTGEYMGTGRVHVAPFTGLPPGCTTVEPPKSKDGFAIIYDTTVDEWDYIEDFRGVTVWNKETKVSHVVDYLGYISDEFTTYEPKSEFDRWNGVTWVTDPEAEKLNHIQEAARKKSELMEVADKQISIISRAVKFGNATEDEIKALEEWELFTVLLSRVDTNLAPDVVFPDLPH